MDQGMDDRAGDRASRSRSWRLSGRCGLAATEGPLCLCRLVSGDRRAGAGDQRAVDIPEGVRSEEHTSELQSLMRISYAVFCLKKKNTKTHPPIIPNIKI